MNQSDIEEIVSFIIIQIILITFKAQMIMITSTALSSGQMFTRYIVGAVCAPN